ncbi:MAG: hypothetical protein J5629_05120 [Muribaculaceae bacterium]|nr:hypothetical protein [Muribaculaceae bacterium]
MKKYASLFWVMLMLVASFNIMTSCSDNDEPNNSGRNYDLDVKVIETRECHALKSLANDFFNLKFRQIIFEFTSVGPDMKTPVRLTGVISMNPAVFNKEAVPRALMFYHEFTTAKHRERTSQDEIDDVSFYMNKFQNLIAVSCDLYGWTLTEDKPQAYCCPEITAQESIDCWDAAMSILLERGYEIKGLRKFNVGYSSGGFSAIAFQRYVDKNRSDLNIDLTCAGAAPFDICTIYEDYVETDYSGYICALPLMMVAYKETYNMDFSYSDVFKEPLASHIQEWILSKDYGTWDINGLIGTEKISDVLTPAACNYKTGIGKKVYDKFRQNSLCGEGQNWQPSTKTKFFIMHSSGDKYMTYKAGVEMADYLKSKGCDVETDFKNSGNHVKYGLLVFTAETIVKMEKILGGDIEEYKQAIEDAKNSGEFDDLNVDL